MPTVIKINSKNVGMNMVKMATNTFFFQNNKSLKLKITPQYYIHLNHSFQNEPTILYAFPVHSHRGIQFPALGCTLLPLSHNKCFLFHRKIK